MKKIFATAIAAAALFSFASCQKESADAPAKRDRIITAAFSNDGTRTTLDTIDNITPLWSVGDVIRVLSSTTYEDITLAAGNIKDDGKKIEFTTTLEGMLYAVYPASVTTMTSCSDGNISFTIPAIQDGTFGSANICVASGDGVTSNEIYFSNATAVVEMTLATNVVGAKFAAENNVAGGMTVTMGNKGAISGTTTTSLSSKTVSISDTKAPSGGKFYMAVAPGETGAVTITCNTLNKSGSIGKNTKTLARDKIYAMNLAGMEIDTDIDLTGQHGVLNGQEYVIIKAKYNGTDSTYLKWATQNLAVTASGKGKWKSTNYVIGDYFQWAASYEGYGITEAASKIPANLVIYDSFVNTFTTSGCSFTFKSSKTSGFVIGNAPYSNGSSYTKYTETDTKTTLESSDDVASIVLGGTWRMPTGGNNSQFDAMHYATNWTWNDTDKGYYVTKSGESLLQDKSNALLFIPATGSGYDTDLLYAGQTGRYWSSTLHNSVKARYMLLSSSSAVESYNDRCKGFSVRPVSD